MMIVSSSSVCVNRLRVTRSTVAGGGSGALEVFGCSVEKSTAYKAPGAAIATVPLPVLPPIIAFMNTSAVTVDPHAAAGVKLASAPKYTSSGVWYSSI